MDFKLITSSPSHSQCHIYKLLTSSAQRPPNQLETDIHFVLNDNTFYISADPALLPGDLSHTSTIAPLAHPTVCPFAVAERTGVHVSDLPVSVSACILITALVRISSELITPAVLLTRRPKHMRSFPGVWVPPGGRVERDETLDMAAIREMEEETGIRLSAHRVKMSQSPAMFSPNCRVLGLWESVFPPFLEMGVPKRRHEVVYLEAAFDGVYSGEELLSMLTPEVNEVDVAAWFDTDAVNALLNGDADAKDIRVAALCFDGREWKKGSVPLANLVSSPDEDVEILADAERLTSGTIYALGKWLEIYRNTNSL
ncbi:NUDIX hydrolase domain-like protein [Cladochytrium replicatum]|nr:NUDIX hydrolase domain-like protein [Cladochytrium replicatum]